MPHKQAFGTWKSPISPKMLSGNMKFYEVQWADDSETLLWLERRSTGGTLVMQRGTDAMRDMTDSSISISGRVLYGGGEFTSHSDTAYFVSSGHLFRVNINEGTPRPVTPKFGGAGAPNVSPDGRWIFFVHTYKNDDTLLIVDSQGKQFPQKIAQGNDFYMQPIWHPSGDKIAYVTWNQPNMPWNGSELYLANLTIDKSPLPYVASDKLLAGDENTAIFQPEFSPDGRYLSYISDTTGFGHIYLYDLKTGKHTQITQGDYEHGTPAWVQGLRMYAWTGDSYAIYYVRIENGTYGIWVYDIAQEQSISIRELSDYSYIQQITVSDDGEKLAFIGEAPKIPPRIVTWSATDGVRVVRRATTESIPQDYLSPAKPISWQGHDDETVYGLYSPPTNPRYEGIGRPPLMVFVHGGPTSHRAAGYEDEVQFFTSRGFAALQVNHRGSTTYGKAYMDKHKGEWGNYDVRDSISGAQYLVDEGLADGEKLIIMGGSAGGYTALQALVDYPTFFAAGVVSYGISNQFALVQETHKFEARYSDWLLGELPEAADKYRDRSPLYTADDIEDPVIIFQGSDDEVVPKNQSDSIVRVLRRNGVPHEYVVYEGEGHGFKQPENVEDFYTRTLGFLTEHVLYK